MNFGKIFSRRRPVTDGPSDIGHPTNVQHEFHVVKNSETGQLEGLPSAWIRFMDTQISKAEQNENPDAALQALKYYNYSIRKKPTEPFKTLVTKEVIEEESEEIENILGGKERKVVDVSPSKDQASSDVDQIATELESADIKGGEIDEQKWSDQSADDQLLRTKAENNQKSDEYIYEELRKICRPTSEFKKFTRSLELGSGLMTSFPK